MSLHANGVKDNRISGALGAIPYVENLNADAIARFQEQVQVVNLLDTEDMGAITSKVRELASKDPGAFDAEPLIVEISEEGEEEEEGGAVRPVSGEIAVIRSRLKAIEARMTLPDLLVNFRKMYLATQLVKNIEIFLEPGNESVTIFHGTRDFSLGDTRNRKSPQKQASYLTRYSGLDSLLFVSVFTCFFIFILKLYGYPLIR